MQDTEQISFSDLEITKSSERKKLKKGEPEKEGQKKIRADEAEKEELENRQF